ncbi:Mechanosensitive ion channel [Selenomonas ruminantium]|uniref:Mechanosensitive ion channel n=2 Tax=Selenomonas ruminantium TaxID=971 RepID=A0A1H3ZXF3_SELRU|nr:Mechanosensitive ion channel [Selenomonas ruminantium]SFA82203.1 Mechanosensitive ion channel [Selenomonas ruminantium]
MLNMEWLSWFDWTHLMEMLLVPACILVAALTAGITLNRMIKKRIMHRLTTDETSWQNILINALQGVPISFCLVVGLYWIVNTIDIIEPLVRIFSYILFTVIILTITRVIARTVSGVIDMQIERSQQAVPKTTLLNAIVNGIIYAMGILVVLQYYGISIAPILTALGVGGMAVALALQETLANIFSGLHLILSKQLRLGDYIHLSSGEEGRVTDITWRFTTIVPVGEGNMVVIPNQKIASSIITNYSMPRHDIVIKIPVGVAYDSDLQKVEDVTLEVARQVLESLGEKIDDNRKPTVRFYNFGESSIDFNVLLHSARFDDQFRLKHEFIKALTARFRQEGIEIPFPIRTIVQQ